MIMKEELIKATRVIIIQGDRAWVEKTLQQSYLQPNSPINFSGHMLLVEISRTIEKLSNN